MTCYIPPGSKFTPGPVSKVKSLFIEPGYTKELSRMKQVKNLIKNVFHENWANSANRIHHETSESA